jgi:hypothetical protein
MDHIWNFLALRAVAATNCSEVEVEARLTRTRRQGRLKLEAKHSNSLGLSWISAALFRKVSSPLIVKYYFPQLDLSGTAEVFRTQPDASKEVWEVRSGHILRVGRFEGIAVVDKRVLTARTAMVKRNAMLFVF